MIVNSCAKHTQVAMGKLFEAAKGNTYSLSWEEPRRGAICDFCELPAEVMFSAEVE